MDTLASWGNSLSQVTAYDIKSYYNQAVNMVLNLTEMESKVREATNDDSWGASSTLMREIAEGTKNFQQFNEIMPMIYKRFTETEARDWRQIYKALQLLEYLVKHGSERVVDNAISHSPTIEMLQSFHYIDDKGKDQGVNVRTRAKEIRSLLADSNLIRQERRKAKATRNNYVSTSSDAYGGSSFSGSSSRYGGSGSGGGGGDRDAYYGDSSSAARSGDDYGRYGPSSASRQGTAISNDFEEYDAGDWDDRSAKRNGGASQPSTASRTSHTASSRTSGAAQPAKEQAPPPKAKATEVDFFSFDDEPAPPVPPSASTKVAPPAAAVNVGLDDDFDDFQSAPSASGIGNAAPVAAAPAAAKPNVFALLNATSPTAPAPPTGNQSGTFFSMQSPPIQANRPAMASPPLSMTGASPNYMSPIPIATNVSPMAANKPMSPVTSPVSNSKPLSAKDAFGDDLFSSFASMGVSGTNKTSGGANTNKSMAAMAKQQSSATIWGTNQALTNTNRARPAAPPSMGSSGVQGGFGGDDDLLL